MAVDAFLKLDGIDGESKDDKYPKYIDILDVHFALNQTGSGGYGGGSGTAKVVFHDLSVTKRFDRASPVLMGKCADGTHIKNGLIILRKAAGTENKPLEYLKIKMDDIIISQVTPSGLGSGDGMEHVTLNFSKIVMDYQEQNEKGGSEGGLVTFGWDVKANKKTG